MVIYYHGTSKEHLESILKQGLLSGHITRNITDPKLYLTRYKNIARQYSDYAPKSENAIVKINIPKSKIGKGYGNLGEFTPNIAVMDLIHKEGVAVTRGGVPRKYIKAIIIGNKVIKV